MNNPIDQAYQVREKLAALEEALTAKTPGMPTLLREIHRELKADPDVVTILSPQECSILVKGLKQQTSVTIATNVAAAKPKKALKNLTVGDL